MTFHKYIVRSFFTMQYFVLPCSKIQSPLSPLLNIYFKQYNIMLPNQFGKYSNQNISSFRVFVKINLKLRHQFWFTISITINIDCNLLVRSFENLRQIFIPLSPLKILKKFEALKKVLTFLKLS